MNVVVNTKDAGLRGANAPNTITIMKKKRMFAAPPTSSSCTSIFLAKILHSNGSAITAHAIRVPCHGFGIQVGFSWMARPSTIPPSRNATCVKVAIHAARVIHPCKNDQNLGDNRPRGAYKALQRYLSFELFVRSIKVDGVAKLTVLPRMDSCLPFQPDWLRPLWFLPRTTTCPRLGK